jgi:phosphomannomutase
MISISGIRGTLGSGQNNLNPVNLTEFVVAFARILKEKKKKGRIKVVVGRDGRISGKMFLDLTINILLSQGVDVCNLDLASTPTIEMGVISEKADGGIIISASHNPMNWNALKLLNHQGEFIDNTFGKKIIELLKEKDFVINSFSELEKLDLGKLQNKFNYHHKHIADILKLKLVKTDLIKRANFKVVLDGVNSVGAIAISDLLKSLGLKNIIVINSEINGKFSHNPEPIDKNLKQLCLAVKKNKADRTKNNIWMS